MSHQIRYPSTQEALMEQITWQGVTDVNPTSFKCAYCGKDVSSHKGWHANAPPRGHGSASQDAAIFLCHRCLRPTFIDTDGSQTPGAPAGEDVQGISDESVKLLYKEVPCHAPQPQESFSFSSFSDCNVHEEFAAGKDSCGWGAGSYGSAGFLVEEFNRFVRNSLDIFASRGAGGL